MRKILIVLGLGMLVMSCAVFFVGGNITASNLSRASATAVNPATYCKAGEKLATPQPRNTLATPGKDFATLGFYYCVDDAGHQRDITSDVMKNAFGQLFTFLPGWATISMVAFGLFCLGLPILIIGAILSLRGQRSSPQFVELGSPVSAASGSTQADNPSFTDQLRELDQAYREGLISEEEYQRLRQQILDQIG